MNYYEFKQDLQIILYGINSYAKELSVALKKKGIGIYAYWDRRAEEVKEVNDVPVYFYNNYPKGLNKKEICVIIMLQNALQHDEVARELFDNGFRKIIYVPMKRTSNEKLAQEFRRIYNLILLKQFDDIHRIPFFETMLQKKKQGNSVIYEETKDFFTVKVPVDIVYTDSLREVKGTTIQLKKNANIPLAALKPYMKMFEYLEGKGSDLDDYLNDYSDSDILTSRGMLYELWSEQFEKGMNFFISSAPLAEWNEKGYFNLLEGHHRTSFLLRKGIRYVPLRISKIDYEKWYKRDIVEKFKNMGSDIFFINCPIQNPAFQDITFYNKMSIINSILHIQGGINKESYKDKRILDIGSFMGYYGMNMKRMGARDVTIISSTDQEKNIIKNIIQLYGLSDIEIKKENNLKNVEEFSMIIAIGYREGNKEFKSNLLLQFHNLDIECLLFSLSKEEKQNLKEKERERYCRISSIFLQGEMQDIYICYGTIK